MTYATDGKLWHAMHGTVAWVRLGAASTYCGRTITAKIITDRKPAEDERCARCERAAKVEAAG